MLPAKLDPNQEPLKHPQKNIWMTLEKMAYHFQMGDSTVNKYYSVGHHEQKNKKNTGQSKFSESQ